MKTTRLKRKKKCVAWVRTSQPMIVDSGASEPVVGEGMLMNLPIRENLASRSGVEYEVANGVRILNLGEKLVNGTTNEGMQRCIRAQVCDLNKPLLSVRKLVTAGNSVVFDPERSYNQDGWSGEKMWLSDNGGMLTLKLWMKGDTSGF